MRQLGDFIHEWGPSIIYAGAMMLFVLIVSYRRKPKQ